MTKSKFNDEQILSEIAQVEAGVPVAELEPREGEGHLFRGDSQYGKLA